MSDLATLCTRLGLDEAVARQGLAAEADAVGHPVPWYVQAILGVGAWITALLMIVFVALFMNLVLDVDEPDLGTAVIGLAMFAVGLLLQSHAGRGVFVQQFAVALTVAGAAIAAASIGFELEELWAAAVTAAALAASDLWRGRQAPQQFLLAALAVGLAIAALSEDETRYRIDIVALAVPVGLWLYLRPPRLDARPLATVLLLTLPLYGLMADSPYAPAGEAGGWIARMLAAACVAALLWLRSRVALAPDPSRRLAVVVPVAGAICLLLPPGGSAALVILLLAFTLGHWPLAIVGILLQAYFLPRFYYDLELSLLTKSWLLMGVGGLLLLLYATASRRGFGAS